eukprot:Lithocolla_globosa_v1_NODE_102_length_6350_cov_93.725179.p7 type:complete len:101 gc:universal NODE_102_length_6350_cov_93.725179:5202-4900(-)
MGLDFPKASGMTLSKNQVKKEYKNKFITKSWRDFPGTGTSSADTLVNKSEGSVLERSSQVNPGPGKRTPVARLYSPEERREMSKNSFPKLKKGKKEKAIA